ncbi:hypothetical protein FJT64_020981 [Amphibalanus amphitrite]|uniref:Uncharacterized protein n=1 Tax=Amphibalanus amphitrite TaxID=1232801 RepID=A0A6A4X0F1_AMPAM|nr:hypothetical protein FJT64_020981 [Amphibalanus amphitrite]
MLTGVNQLTQEEQRASLYSLVDDEWHRIIKFGLNITETASLNDTIRAMEDHLRSQRNVILDRRDFFRRNQQPDESFDDYLIALKEISEFCDFCRHCTEDRLRDRIITGLHDETAVQTLLSEKDLTLQKTVDICRARENAFVNASALAGDRLNAVSAYRRGARSYSCARSASRSRRAEPEGRGSGADPVGSARIRDTTPERRCRFCGDEWHQQLAMCPARNHRCSKCNKLHHSPTYAEVTRFGHHALDSMKTGNQIVSNRLCMSLPHSERCHHHGEGIYVTCTASTCEVYQRDGRRKSTSKYNTPVDMLSSHGYPTAVQRSAL